MTKEEKGISPLATIVVSVEMTEKGGVVAVEMTEKGGVVAVEMTPS